MSDLSNVGLKYIYAINEKWGQETVAAGSQTK